MIKKVSMKSGLSIIIPFVLESPQVQFTVRALSEQLKTVDFNWEIIVVNNYCEEVQNQQKKRGDIIEDDAGGNHLKNMEKFYPWLKYYKYTKKLSHWQCKNLAVEKAKYVNLFFMDSHCLLSIDALAGMYDEFINLESRVGFSMHLPITYHILENKKLIYKAVTDIDKGICGYSFTSAIVTDSPLYKVPCMSTCGMMIDKINLSKIGGWPKKLGIYSGGEQFLNFTMAICGMNKYIYNGGVLHHHGSKRKYHWNFDDFHKNNSIAAYIFGGKKWAILRHKNSKAAPLGYLEEIFFLNGQQRESIKKIQIKTIQEWIQEQI